MKHDREQEKANFEKLSTRTYLSSSKINIIFLYAATITWTF